MTPKNRIINIIKKSVIGAVARKIYCFVRTMKNKCREKMIRFYPICKNKIVFINFNGKGYGCNPKYVAQEIIKQKLPVKLVWLVSDMSEEMPQEIKKVKWGSLEARRELSTARVWIKNIKNFSFVNKRKGQYYIQVWHGNMPLKYIEQDAESTLSTIYVEQSKQDSQMTDLMLAGCRWQEELMREKFWYNGKILSVGIPRNDIFFHNTFATRQKIMNYFHIAEESGIILFAPTFRNIENNCLYELDSKNLMLAAERRFHKRFVIIKRLHPIVKHGKEINQGGAEIDATDYSDMQELLVAADILVTDYSGCMYDFSLMKKPVFLLGRDYAEYVETERGMYTDVTKLPFPFAGTERELWKNIEMYDEDKYLEELGQLWEDLQTYDNGHASELVVEEIKKVMHLK